MEVMKMIDEYYPKALYSKIEGEFCGKYKYGADHRLSYSIGMAKYFENVTIPVVSIFDDIQEYRGKKLILDTRHE